MHKLRFVMGDPTHIYNANARRCPPRTRPLKTEYALTKKITPDGSVMKCKARKVVQGFHQVHVGDFFETFFPVVGFDTLRTVIKMMVEHGG